MFARFAFRKRPGAGVALGLAGCLGGGCAVERTTAVERVGSVPGDAGSSSGGTKSSSGSATSSSSGSSEAGSSCTMANALCTASNSGCNVGSYYLYDNQWNCGGSTGNSCGPESAYGCANSDSTVSWVVTSNQPAGNTAVLSYPAMQDKFPNTPLLSSFSTISATFAETSPHVGTYEYAFDVWLNGVATAGSTQILIWVDNYNRIPSGTKVATTTRRGRSYDVWNTSDNSHIVLISTVAFTSGTVDLLDIIDWTIAQGWLRSGSTLGQIDFGVEIASTDGSSATYEVNAFSIATN